MREQRRQRPVLALLRRQVGRRNDDRRHGSRGGSRSSRSVHRSRPTWRAALPAWPIFGLRESARENPAARSNCSITGKNALSAWCGEQKYRKMIAASPDSRCSNARSRRDLPIPGSPPISTIRPRPAFCLLPAAQQQFEFFVAADQRRQLRRTQRQEAACGGTLHRSLARLRSGVRNPPPVSARMRAVRKVHEPAAACWRRSTRHRLGPAKAAPPPGSTARPTRPVAAVRSRRDPRPPRGRWQSRHALATGASAPARSFGTAAMRASPARMARSASNSLASG